MSYAISANSQHCKVFLLGTSALISLALAAPVMAEDFVITGSNSSTNGTGIAADAINGGDTVRVTGTIDTGTTAVEGGIETTGSNTITVSTDGIIKTGGANAYGIRNIDDTNTTTMSGRITTSGGIYSYGVYNSGADNVTTVLGTITTSSTGSTGVYNYGDDNTTTLSGSIFINGWDSEGILEKGEGNTTNVSGNITTTNTASVGIRGVGNKNSTTLSGSISTEGTYFTRRGSEFAARGIEYDGNENSVIISSEGNLTTTGERGHGVVFEGNTNETSVSGSIATAGDDAYGIYNKGDTNTTTMSGSIKTSEKSGFGIHNEGNSNETTVSGNITTTGEAGHGIYNLGDKNTTTLSGSITTSGQFGAGIYNHGDENTTIMSGSITTSEKDSIGIANYGDKNITTVSGSITTSGRLGHGILNAGNTNTPTTSGTVKATGASSAALYNRSGSGNSFTLDEGAIIIGDILADDNATNSKLTFNLGASASYAYSVSGKGGGTGKGAGTGVGQWTFSDLDGRTPLVTTGGTGCDTTITGANNTVCNLVTAVGTDNAEVQDELQFSTNASMIGSMSLGSNAGGSAEDASVTQASNNSWVNVYGGSSKRDASTTQSYFNTSDIGLTVGIPMAISDTLNVDLVFNTSNTKLDIGASKDQKITGKSYNVGAVLRDLAPSTDWAVDAFGFIGRNSYDGKRKVMNNQEATGSETVTAAYSSNEILVGVDAQNSKPINKTLSFISGVNASVSNEKIGAYSESQSYAWDARTLTQVVGGVTAGLEYHKGALTTSATLGLQRSSLSSGKTAGYTNNGTAGSYTDDSGATTHRTATLGLSYAVKENMSVTGTADVKGSSASLSANWAF